MMQAIFKKKIVLNSAIVPYWIKGTDSFWYLKETRNGNCYRLVNARSQTNSLAFDHRALASSLIEESGENLTPEKLPISDITITLSPTIVIFSAFGNIWKFDNSVKQCKKIDTYPSDWKISPDGKKAAFVKNYNLWVKDLVDGEERALTKDGAEFYTYGCAPTVSGRDLPPIMDYIWSPDSSHLLSHLIDTTSVRKAVPLIQYVPVNATYPTILNPNRRVASSQDENVEAWQLLSVEVTTGHIQLFDYKPCAIRYPHYLGLFCAGRGWWGLDSRYALCIYQEVDGTGTKLIRCDSRTGGVEVLLEEMPETEATIIPATQLRAMSTPLKNSDEFVWYSERSGWAHLYLYNAQTGQLKNAITSGKWVVRNILHIDEQRREIYIQTAGRVVSRNPYYRDICRVNIDTGLLTTIISSDHEYAVVDKRSFGFPFVHEKALGVSMSGNYIIATRSRIDQVPESILLDREGNEILVLEAADISGLPNNWQWPEPVIVKGDDGITDIYASVFRPSDFSENKSYPVLDLSFTYSEPVGSFSNDAVGGFNFWASLAYAELGFIVVRFNNRGDGLRGGAGLRNREFNSFKDTSVPFHNKADCVAGIKQLSKLFPYMNMNKVGVADYVSVPAAVTGMLVYPEFYKVGVSFNSMVGKGSYYPQGIYRGNGFPPYEDFADNLAGKLLLMHGMLDASMPVAATFSLAEALQAANKNFDMLILPNVEHQGSEYCTRRCWDYLVTHLLGEDPPENFNLSF